MYADFFGLAKPPFSIAPDPQSVYLSPRHREALAHLLYGVQDSTGGGVVLLSGIDFSMDPRALIGDALALVAAMFAAAYVTIAERVRQTVPTATMTSVLYLVSALTIVPIAVLAEQPFLGFSAQAWLMIIAVTVGAQLLGHTLMNKVLATTSATVVSMAILLEMPGATLIAAIWLGQIPPLAIYPAIGLISIGLVIVIRSSSPRAPMESSPI